MPNRKPRPMHEPMPSLIDNIPNPPRPGHGWAVSLMSVAQLEIVARVIRCSVIPANHDRIEAAFVNKAHRLEVETKWWIIKTIQHIRREKKLHPLKSARPSIDDAEAEQRRALPRLYPSPIGGEHEDLGRPSDSE